MAESDLRNMIMNFRVSDLQVLLGYAGKNKTGKKQELQSRALDLVKLNTPQLIKKINDLHNRRYHNQLGSRTTNYDIPEGTLSDRPMSSYDSSVNNFGARCNANIRPMSVNHGATPMYPSKPYIPPVQSHTPYSTYADVKFKDLPFYDVLHMLLKPFSMIPDPGDRVQESVYNFTLNGPQAHEVALSRDGAGNFECQILLRFCFLDSGTEQEDNIPPSISIKVNGKPVTLPNPVPTSRPGVEPRRPGKPVNITPYTKLSPTVINTVSLTWSSSYGRSFAGVLYIAKYLTASTLLNRLRNRGFMEPDQTKSLIIEKLQQDFDSEIATTSLQASLICPLGKIKIQHPCRAYTCTHIACFDALLYIQLNEKKPKWQCPVCDKQAFFKDLVIDGFFMDIVTKVPAECTDVTLHDDGSWAPIMPVKVQKPKETLEPVKKAPAQPVEVFDISSDSDTEEWNMPSKKSHLSSDSDSPPLVLIPTEGNLSPCLTPPLTCYPPLVTPINTNYVNTAAESVEPVPVCLTSSLSMQSSDVNILPDIVSASENSMSPSYVSGLGSSAYQLYTDPSLYAGAHPSSGTYQKINSFVQELYMSETDTNLQNSVPSVSGPGPQPYSSDSSAFYSTKSHPKSNTYQKINTFVQEQYMPETNQNVEPFNNNFDILSLLQIPESEREKYQQSMSKELAEQEANSNHDIISLD